jgi:hypothetical protein
MVKAAAMLESIYRAQSVQAQLLVNATDASFV